MRWPRWVKLLCGIKSAKCSPLIGHISSGEAGDFCLNCGYIMEIGLDIICSKCDKSYEF